MFNSARIKLTVWYLFIIMLISLFFSAAIYRVLTSELDRIARVQRLRIENQLPFTPGFFPLPNPREDLRRSLIMDPDLINETKSHIITILAIINLAILGASTTAGYFLAGRTLKPIKEMVDEQNRFITDASHELRTPLTSLKSEIEVNLRSDKLTLPEARTLLVSNLEEVNNLQNLSDKLIKLAQFQTNENGLFIVSVQIFSVVSDAIKKVKPMAKNKNIAIVNKVKNCRLEGDKQALTELFVIFLDNAIKYSPKGSRINLTGQKTDGHIAVNIADQGIGINPNEIPNLFNRFYRADKSRTKSDSSGYGLGLSIAKQIIDRHHGSITVKSVPGKGSTFTVSLPVAHNRNLI